MSFNNANIVIQDFVDNYGNTGRTFNVIDYVLRTSAANTAITLTPPQFLNAPGKNRTVRMNYFPIQCDVEGDCGSSLCDDGEAIEPVQRDFEIKQCTATKKYRVNYEDIRKVDYNNWDFSGVALQIIASMMPEARKMLAQDWMGFLWTLKGVHTDGNATKRISVTNPATGVVNPIGRLQISKEYQDAGFNEPYILGDQEVLYWQKMTATGGLNAQGQRIDMGDTANSWYDQNIMQNIAGDLSNGGWILTIDPQVFKYVNFIKNAGIFRTDVASIADMDKLFSGGYGEGFMLGTVTDPVTGIVWDLYVNFVKCAQDGTDDMHWTVQLKHRWDMFVMDGINCNAEGVNAIMAWRTCPAVIAPCPTGDTPSPAVNPKTYSWTPGSIFPLKAFNFTLGQKTVGLNSPADVANITDLVAAMNDAYGVPGLFTVSGSNVHYSGFTELDGNINSGAITVNFS